jgi:hypothetical protein
MSLYSDESTNQLAEITTISQIISELYAELESSLSDPNISSQESDNIIRDIERLTKVKNILIGNYLQMNANAQQTSISQKIAYDETMNAISATNKEMEIAKKKIALLNQEKYNRLRLIEINNYYGSQYSNHQKIIMYIIGLCIFFLITIILKNKNILPSNVFYWLNIIVISISIIVIAYMVKESYSHNNMNYEEYDYDFNYNQAILDYPITPTTTTANAVVNTAPTTCNVVSGSSFCSDNQTFNDTTQKCETNIIPPNSSAGDLFIIDKSNNSQISI